MASSSRKTRTNSTRYFTSIGVEYYGGRIGRVKDRRQRTELFDPLVNTFIPNCVPISTIISMAPPTYPPGGTFFDTLKKNFNDVPIDESKGNAIATGPFLEASESLTTLFGMCFYHSIKQQPLMTISRRPRLGRIHTSKVGHGRQHQKDP